MKQWFLFGKNPEINKQGGYLLRWCHSLFLFLNYYLNRPTLPFLTSLTPPPLSFPLSSYLCFYTLSQHSLFFASFNSQLGFFCDSLVRITSVWWSTDTALLKEHFCYFFLVSYLWTCRFPSILFSFFLSFYWGMGFHWN